MDDGIIHNIHSYSSHYDEDPRVFKKRYRKKYRNVGQKFGEWHSNTAVEWVLGLKKSLNEGYAVSKFGDIYINDGKFNVYYRVATPDLWVEIDKIDNIYFEMKHYNLSDDELL